MNRKVRGNYKPRTSRAKTPLTIQEKHRKQMRGLCVSINKACDEWLRKRGIVPQDWKSQQKREAKKRLGS